MSLLWMLWATNDRGCFSTSRYV